MPAVPWWAAPGIAAVLLVLWEGASRLGLISALHFPPPTVIGRTVARLATERDLAGHTLTTLGRLGRGLLLGGVPGLVLGWVMGWSRRARSIADPFVAAAHPIPKIAVLPLLIIVLGIGDAPRIVAVAIGVFFPLVISAMTGVRQISPIHFDVARNVGARRLKVFWRVVVPGSLPVVMGGVRLAVNVGLLITVAVELVFASRGLGFMLMLARETFRPEEIYAALVVLMVIGLVTNGLVQLATRRLVPWRAEPEV